jgi:hypothetical protein
MAVVHEPANVLTAPVEAVSLSCGPKRPHTIAQVQPGGTQPHRG